jgi:hypothetical protein
MSRWLSRRTLRQSALLLLLLLCAPARAEDAFQGHYDQAMKLYGEREYAAAIEQFQAAYGLRQLPRLLFAIAQCHRRLGHAREALAFYEQYLRVAGELDAKHRADVESYMAQMRELLKAPQVEQAPQPQQGPAAPAQGGGAAAPSVVEAGPPPRRPLWRILVGSGAGAAGLGLLSVGAWGVGLNGACVAEPQAPKQVCAQVYDSLAPGAGLLAAGGVLLVGGIVLAAWPPRKAGPEKREKLDRKAGTGALRWAGPAGPAWGRN